MLEGVDAGIEALGVEEDCQLLVLHIDAIDYYLIDVPIHSEYFAKIHIYIPSKDCLLVDDRQII